MPNLENKDLYQRAVLWPVNGVDQYGQTTVGDPVEIAVRWLTVRREAFDRQGNPIVLDGTAVVNRRIAPGSRVWLGTLHSWSPSTNQYQDDELMEVKNYNDTPDIKNRFIRHTVDLMRYRQTEV